MLTGGIAFLLNLTVFVFTLGGAEIAAAAAAC